MRLFVCLLASTVILVGCQGNPAVSKTENNNAEKSKAVVDDRLVQANTRFGFKMFAELAKHSADANIFVSAPSVAIALTMTYNGADSTTRDAMASALELSGLSLDQVNQANRALKSLLENPDSAVTLSIANSLWAREGLPFLPDFMNRNKEFYGARVTSLNFDDPGAAPTINAWVSENTHEKIQQIVDAPIDEGTILFLINAIYFKGAWTKTFDKTGNYNYHCGIHPSMTGRIIVK